MKWLEESENEGEHVADWRDCRKDETMVDGERPTAAFWQRSRR